ncbi:hypothetical protein [Rhodanobacter lindaniclasticus]
MSVSTESLPLAKDAYVDDKYRPLNDWNNPVSINGHLYVVVDSAVAAARPAAGVRARAFQSPAGASAGRRADALTVKPSW